MDPQADTRDVRIAQALLTYETVTGEEIEKPLGGMTVADLRPEEPERSEEASDRRESTPAPEPKSPGGEHSGDLPGEPGLSPA